MFLFKKCNSTLSTCVFILKGYISFNNHINLFRKKKKKKKGKKERLYHASILYLCIIVDTKKIDNCSCFAAICTVNSVDNLV